MKNKELDENVEVVAEEIVEPTESAESDETTKADKEEKVEEEAEKNNGENDESAKCGDDKKKKCADDEDDETAKCGDEKKKKTAETEVSALTGRDLEREIDRVLCKKHMYCYGFTIFPLDGIFWCIGDGCNTELDRLEFTFTVENDVVIISDDFKVVSLVASPKEVSQIIAQKDSAIVEMSNQVQSLTSEIASLRPYKERVEAMEKEQREAEIAQKKEELKKYAISSKYITAEEIETSEEIKGFIEALDISAIKSIIADRVIASLNDKPMESIDVSEAETKETVQINLSAVEDDESKVDAKSRLSAMRHYLGK